LETLNQQRLAGCQTDLEDRTRGKAAPKRELLAEDQAAFLPLPNQPFEARRIEDGTANSESLVRFDTNEYSVPVRYAHRKLIVVATVEEVRLVYQDRLVARHRRCWERERTFFEPVHYLALLERKPGGFDHARPLEHWDLPECFALLRRRLEVDDPRHGARSFIRALRLLEKFSQPQLTAAVEYVSDSGMTARCDRIRLDMYMSSTPTAFGRSSSTAAMSRCRCFVRRVGRTWRRCGSRPPTSPPTQALLEGVAS